MTPMILTQPLEVQLTDSGRRAVEQVRTLWPTLGFDARIEWVTHLRKFFNDSFVDTVEALHGNVPLPWESDDAVHQ